MGFLRKPVKSGFPFASLRVFRGLTFTLHPMSQLRILVTGSKGRMGHAVIQAVERDPDCVVCGSAGSA